MCKSECSKGEREGERERWRESEEKRPGEGKWEYHGGWREENLSKRVSEEVCCCWEWSRVEEWERKLTGEREGERVTFFGESAINVGCVHSGWKLEEMRKNWKKPPRNVSQKLWFARDVGSSSGSGVFCYRSFSWRQFSSRRFNRSCFVITVIEIESHEATKNLQLILDSSSLSTSTSKSTSTATTRATTTTSATSKPWDNQCCAVLHLTVLVWQCSSLILEHLSLNTCRYFNLTNLLSPCKIHLQSGLLNEIEYSEN